MKRILALFVFDLTVACFGQSQPAIYLTQPFIGNGLSQSTNPKLAQVSIGLDQVVTNGTQTDLDFTRASTFVTNLYIGTDTTSAEWYPYTVGFGGAVLNIDGTDEYILGFDEFKVSPPLHEYGGIMVNSDSFFTNGVYAAFFSGDGSSLTSLTSTNIAGQIALANATIITTNSGSISTNKANQIGLQGTNNLMTASNNLFTAFNQTLSSATNLTAQNAYTNMLIGTNRIANNYSNVIKLDGAGRSQANTSTSTTFKWNGTLKMWTNSTTGDCLTNNSGTYIEQSSAGVAEYNGTIGGSWSLVNGASPAPNSSGWGSIEDLNTSGRVLTNIPANSISGAVAVSVQSTNGPDGHLLVTTNMPVAFMTNTYSWSGWSFQPVGGLGGLSGLQPIISTNQFGILDLAEVRDPVTWYARNKIWIAYTGVTNGNYANYSASVFLASSTNGSNWNLYGCIAHGTGNNTSYRGGCLAPSGVIYDPTNDVLRIYGLATPGISPLGTNSIFEIKWAAAADWTVSNNFTWGNGDAPVLQFQGDGYETNASDIVGPYAPAFVITPTNIMMFYASHGTNVSNPALTYFANAAYPTNGLDSAWKRYGGNPLYGNQYQSGEEPCPLRLPDGSFISLGDAGAIGMDGIWKTMDTNGIAGWQYQGDAVVYTRKTALVSLDAPSMCYLPDGRIFYVAAGMTNGSNNGGRQLYAFIGKLNENNQYIDTTFLHANQIWMGDQTFNSLDARSFSQYVASMTNHIWWLFGSDISRDKIKTSNMDLGGLGNYQAMLTFGNLNDPTKTMGLQMVSGSGELGVEGYDSIGFYVNHTAMVTNAFTKIRAGGFDINGVFSATNITSIAGGQFTGNGVGLTNLSTISMPYRSGLTNMPNLATSAAIIFPVPLNPNVGTNYSITFGEEGSFSATSFSYPSAKTTNGFTLNLTTGITGGGVVTWTATPATQTNGVSVGY